MNNEHLLDSKQVSEILHVSTRTLRRWCKRKIINYILVANGTYKFRPSAVQNFIDRHRQLVNSNVNKKKGKTPGYITKARQMTDQGAQEFFKGVERDEDGNITLAPLPSEVDD